MKNAYNGQTVPAEGKAIGYSGGALQVPDSPIIPYIEGDGTGRDIWKASRRVFDAAVEHAYGGKKKIAWFEVFAGASHTPHLEVPDAYFAVLADFLADADGR